MDVTGSNLFSDLGLTRPQQDKGTRELGQADFLRLMLAQVQNQNPLEPQSNGEFLGQLAQFGIVDGVQQLNGGFGDLSDRLAGEQTLAAASLLGRDVLVAGDRRVTGSGMSGAVKLPQPSDRVVVDIVDARGATVRRLTLDGSAGGEVPFVWDGRNAAGEMLPIGEYGIAARSRQGFENIGLATLIAAPVTAVSRDGSQVMLDLDGLPPARISDIRRIA